MGANTTKQVAWLTGAAKDDSIGLLAGSAGALTTTTFTLSSLLANDPGSAGFYGVYATATPYSNASTKTPLASSYTSGTTLGGTVTVANGIVTYTPPAAITASVLQALPAGATINDSFYYVIWMADRGAYSLALATVKLTGIDDAANITGTIAGDVVEDVTTSFSGNLSIVDPDTGESGFAAASVAGTYGTLTLTPGTLGSGSTPGTATWTYALDHDLANSLAEGEQHTETFTLASIGGTPVTVTVTVTGTNDGPTAAADVASTTENAAVTTDVIANDTDPDNNHQLSVLSVDGVTGGGSASVVDGQVVYDPGTALDHLAEGATATVTVNYTMQDEHGATSSSTVTVTVTGENDGPAASDDNASTGENTAATINVLANDTDPDDGAVLSVVSVDDPHASIDGNGNVVFDPGTDFDHLAAGASEAVTFSYTMQDEHGATSSASVTLVVLGENDAATVGDDAGTVHEDDVLTTGGTVAISDIDDGEAKFAAASAGDLDGAHGSFTFDADTGAWTYTLDNSDADVQALDNGDTLTDSLTVWSLDGSDSGTITVTIDGADEPNTTHVYIVNHGISTVLEQDTISGFDFNDVLKYAGDLAYDGFTTSDVDGDGVADTVVTFHYIAGNGASGGSGGDHGPGGGSTGQATGDQFAYVEVTLLGYSGFDALSQLNPVPA